MRSKMTLLILFSFLAPLAAGCSSAPPCTVSPIEIEETRADTKDLDKNLEEARKRAKKLETRLAAKKKEFEKKKDVPAKLRKKLDELKKGSGRDEKKKE